jgi:hypothetical protein
MLIDLDLTSFLWFKGHLHPIRSSYTATETWLICLKGGL